jgi:cell pole-organizing protein PopZ
MDEILASIRRIIADDFEVGNTERPSATARPSIVPVRPPRDDKRAPGEARQPEPVHAAASLTSDPAPMAAPSPPPPAVAETDKEIAPVRSDAAEPVREDPPAAAPAPEARTAPAAAPSSPELRPRPLLPPVRLRSQPVPGDAPHTVPPPVQPPAAREPESTVPAPPPAAASPPPPMRDPPPAESLVSTATNASVADAFGSLSRTVFSGNPRTIEDLVKEMLRPMLKVWLDDNLPPLVERLVRAEIERVARGR